MRTLIALGSIAMMLGIASLGAAQGQNTGSGKGSGGKSSPPPGGKKTDAGSSAIVHKGAVTLQSKETKANPQPNKTPTKDVKTYSHQLKMSVDSGNLKLTPGQSAALDKLTSQQPLSTDDRQQLSDLLFRGSQAGLTSQDETALSYLLTDDAARNDETTGAVERVASSSGPMYLRVINKTTEALKVWVQVVAAEVGTASKSSGTEVLRYELQPGKAYDLHNKGERLAATAIRIWAMSPTRQWATNRDRDLPLTASGASKVFAVTFALPTTARSNAEPAGLELAAGRSSADGQPALLAR